MPLVMRLETAAAKFDRKVNASERFKYNIDASDTRDLLLESARRIKELEARRTAPESCPHCHNEDDCSSIEICRAVNG